MRLTTGILPGRSLPAAFECSLSREVRAGAGGGRQDQEGVGRELRKLLLVGEQRQHVVGRQELAHHFHGKTQRTLVRSAFARRRTPRG